MVQIYHRNWAQGKRLNNCPFCGLMPTVEGVPVRKSPILSFLYTHAFLEADWACPHCGSIFDKDNNLQVMGVLNEWGNENYR